MFPQSLQLLWIFLMALYMGSHHSILPCQGGGGEVGPSDLVGCPSH